MVKNVIFNDKYIFILQSWEELENTEFYNRNIICLDWQGKQLWRVEDPDWYRSGKVKTEAPFTSLRFEGGKLIGYTWDCFDIPIDMNTGKLLNDWEFTK